jgi:hypothetical protein
MSAERYPLSWPTGWKRTVPAARQRATFAKGTIYLSTQRLRTEHS